MTLFDEMKKPVTDEGQDPRPSRALVISFFGVSIVLDHQGRDIEYEIEAMGEDHLPESFGETPGDGVWVWEGRMIGECYAHTSEHDAWLEGKWRPATEEEWKSHAACEFVWEVWRPEEPKT